MAIKIKLSSDDVRDINTFAANGNNVYTTLNAASNTAKDPHKTSNQVDVGLGIANTTAGVVQTADMLSKTPSSDVGILGKRAASVTLFGIFLGGAGLTKDGYDISDAISNGGLHKIPVSEVFSAASNAFAIDAARSAAIAGGGLTVAATGVGAPTGGAVAAGSGTRAAFSGAMSVALGYMSNAIDPNLTVGDVASSSWEFFNDKIASGDWMTEALHKVGEFVKDKLVNTHEFMEDFKKNITGYIKDVINGIKETITAIEKAINELQDNPNLPTIADLSDYIANLHPAWAALNRLGKHFFYDPLVLDLDGDGIETVGHNKKQGAMFDDMAINDGFYSLVI